MASAELTSGHLTEVDPEDADLLSGASLYFTPRSDGVGGYVGVRRCGRRTYLHREIVGRMIGRPLLRHEHADHINADGLDNHRANLRLASVSQNQGNRRPNRVSTSAHKGVSFDRFTGKWKATLGKSFLGRYVVEADAARAYDVAALEKWGEFALLNEV